MTNVHDNLEEMNTLKEDAQKLKKKKKRSRPAGEEKTDSDQTILDLTNQIENFAREMEKGAKDHPTLVLVGAFVLGMVVGQLFSRR